ncbi:unnamed protein product [Cyprideis torosa]|uniref:Large ribosomal subunit protein uL3c n=1 Tax=Cyprideis torosa TaxID=163714 RepID=A0A7R8X032_9CRUS|nr:unnamed protein product [Cyprideis torosa]CAG0909589.1 unnamed protein product [Cyprideis torosa]
MTSIFDDAGRNIACTVIETGPCVVTQVKTEDTDGYTALQLGFDDAKEKNTVNAAKKHFAKAGTSPKRKVAEFRDFDAAEKNLGDVVTVDEVFAENDVVSVVGITKGKGFQGVVKRHGFGGVGQATHGQHNRQRAPGSIGAASYPAKVIKGMKMGGRTGGKRRKIRNLQVVKVFADKNLILIKGAVPGHKGAYVILENRSFQITWIMKLDVLNIEGGKTGRQVDLPESIFGVEPNEHAVYLAVKQYLAHQRQGTHKAKERGEIKGSTKKLHRQKGTGGSRKGDIKNPLFRGGGRVFGPRPRNYSVKLNKKVKQLARNSALSSAAAAGNVLILEDFTFDQPKTKQFASILKQISVNEERTLVVLSEKDENVFLSGRNLPKTEVLRAEDLNTYQIVKAGKVVLSEGAVEKMVEVFG